MKSVAFIPKGSTAAAPINSVDAAICAHFNTDVHPTTYFGGNNNWFDGIAFWCAYEDLHSAELEARVAQYGNGNNGVPLLSMLHFLRDNYTTVAY